MGVPSLNTLARRAGREDLPTPTIDGNNNCKGSSPTSQDGLRTVIGGRLNPLFVEEMMMFPIGWTGLEPLGMESYLEWLQGHSSSSHGSSSDD
jgi:hypothetical protein